MIGDQDRLEIERIQNMVGIFGWEINRQEVVDNKIFITMSRDAQVPEVELDAGPS